MLRSKATTFFIHAAGWLVFLGFPLLFMNRTQQSSSSTYYVVLSPYYWLFCLTYIFMFYLNAWYLVPRFVFKKRYVYYGIIVILLSGCVYFLQPFDNLLGHNLLKNKANTTEAPTAIPITSTDSAAPGMKSMPFGPLPHEDMRMQDPRFKRPNGIIFIHQSGNIDMVGLFIFIIVIGLSIAVSTVQKWQMTEKLVVKAEAEKAHAELSFLKAQINPHFLFNTLNNIYALSVTNNKNTSESIMKLSNIMRYVTDEVTEDFVLLEDEINCINDYIDLQKLRIGKTTQLNFTITGEILNQKIAPLLLMTFIENVFKYGISKREMAVINISLNVEATRLIFYCQNTIFESISSIKRKGIGIVNTTQRLEHIYPGKHKLNVNTDNNLFTVNLEIEY
ncbi:sensor histidine kinase [Mucilaginibacter sp.]|uniref:sensor histidine kinase n=1 Tax=Mucilaginibacter sp. TaxID=1882438 RepID=UPI003D0F64E2